jgi:hypothetical protein
LSTALSLFAAHWSSTQSMRLKKLASIVYGASSAAWADQRTGTRTVSKWAALICLK